MSEEYIEISRVLDAPCEQVFAACSSPEQIANWRKPPNYSITKCEADFHVGGKWTICMQAPAGNEMWLGGEYLEITENESIVHTEHMCDASGNMLDPKEMGMDWPKDTEVRMEFSKVDEGKTKFTLRHGKVPASSMRGNVEQGWSQALESLSSFLGKN